jgi:hypothetical protein
MPMVDLICLLFTQYEAKKKNAPQTQVLDELVLEPLNKALQQENGKLKTENDILKEREICKQELMDEYKARAKCLEAENQRAKEENQRAKDEISSLKEKEIRLTTENEFLRRRDEERRSENDYFKRRDEELRLERTAERAMVQTMMSSLLSGMEDRKRKRNDDEATT